MGQHRTIQILSKDDFHAIYVGKELYKEVMVCDLGELLFALDNVETQQEISIILEEFVTRLRGNGNHKIAKIFADSITGQYNSQISDAQNAILLANYISSSTSVNEELKDALDKPVALTIGQYGYPIGPLDRVDKIPINYGAYLHEELDIMMIIKENKRKKLEEEYFPVVEITEEVPEERTSCKKRIKSLFNKLKRQK